MILVNFLKSNPAISIFEIEGFSNESFCKRRMESIAFDLRLRFFGEVVLTGMSSFWVGASF